MHFNFNNITKKLISHCDYTALISRIKSSTNHHNRDNVIKNDEMFHAVCWFSALVTVCQ